MDRGGGHRSGTRGLWIPLLGTLVAVGGWVVLVLVAIRLGASGRDGDSLAWVYLGVTGLAAAACLVLALVLGRELLVVAGLVSEYRGRRARR